MQSLGSERRALARMTVLVVEDDRHTREMYAELLHAHGALAVEAASVRDALRVLAGLAPDAAIVDLALGGTNGRELIAVMRDHPIWAHVRCVVASGDLAAASALPAGVAFLHKPIALEALVHAIGARRAGD